MASFRQLEANGPGSPLAAARLDRSLLLQYLPEKYGDMEGFNPGVWHSGRFEHLQRVPRTAAVRQHREPPPSSRRSRRQTPGVLVNPGPSPKSGAVTVRRLGVTGTGAGVDMSNAGKRTDGQAVFLPEDPDGAPRDNSRHIR